MEDSFGKIVAIFICVIQMFFIPLYLYQENVKRLEQTYLISEITYNIDNFRNTGIIDDDQYNGMRNRIFSLSGEYDVKITHCTNTYDEGDNSQYFNTMFFEEDIENSLERTGVYYLAKNDYINVYIENNEGDVICCYGGSVKNEAY